MMSLVVPRSSTPVALLVFALVACGGVERDADPASSTAGANDPAAGSAASPIELGEPSEPIAPATSVADEVCLPIVSGCGCAYQCALGRRRADGRYDAAHDLQDSRVDETALERRCLDPAGHAYPATGQVPPEATHCIDVLYDLTPCGGECIPTTDYLDCVIRDGRCAPR